MKSKNRHTKKFDTVRKVPLEVIEAAKSGEPAALEYVLWAYHPYITALCRFDVYDASGRHYYCVDDELEHELESKLMLAIMLQFEPTRI